MIVYEIRVEYPCTNIPLYIYLSLFVLGVLSHIWGLICGMYHCRSKFIPVNNQSSFITIISHFAGDHFDGHADFYSGVIHVSELSGDHGTFIQFDEGNGIRCVAVISAGGLVDGGVGVHFSFAAEGVMLLGFVAAVGADVAWGKDLVIAVGADFSDQSIALFFESPMSWNFHNLS